MSGRGTLHIGVLIETMRREGYEFGVGPPQVITKVPASQRAKSDCQEETSGKKERTGRRKPVGPGTND